MALPPLIRQASNTSQSHTLAMFWFSESINPLNERSDFICFPGPRSPADKAVTSTGPALPWLLVKHLLLIN